MNVNDVLLYALIGFVSQLIDGSLGMAYGVCSTTFLTLAGVPIKMASASIHTAEIFTSFASGIAHWKARNVDWTIFKILIIPGVLGGFIGAYILNFIDNTFLQPVVGIYLIIMGFTIVFKVFGKKTKEEQINEKKLLSIGFFGGLFDALGGGGWGPIVTSTMVASGHPPRYTIGSVNIVEFFVTLVQSFAFLFLIGIKEYICIILGLAIGGCVAAPLASYLCKKISSEKMMLFVGVAIIILNLSKIIALLIEH